MFSEVINSYFPANLCLGILANLDFDVVLEKVVVFVGGVIFFPLFLRSLPVHS